MAGRIEKKLAESEVAEGLWGGGGTREPVFRLYISHFSMLSRSLEELHVNTVYSIELRWYARVCLAWSSLACEQCSHEEKRSQKKSRFFFLLMSKLRICFLT